MKLTDVSRILKVVDLFCKMPSVGEGVTTPEIIQWSGVSHSTTYRYLSKLTTLGLLSTSKREMKTGMIVVRYKITEKGQGYILDERMF